MSTLSLRKLKHDSSSVDNITLDSNGRVGVQQASPNVPLEVSGSWRLGTNTSGTYTGGLGGGFNANNNIYSLYCRDRTDTNWNDLWIESKTMSLKVNGGDTAIYMDQSGRVTMPYQPMFCARANSSTNPGINQRLPFPIAGINTGNHYNTGTSTFTAPIAGKYFFYFQALGDANTNNRAIATIQLNGGDYIEASATTKDYNSIQAQVIISLSAGDTVRVQTSVGAEGSRFYPASSTQNWFMGYLIG